MIKIQKLTVSNIKNRKIGGSTDQACDSQFDGL